MPYPTALPSPRTWAAGPIKAPWLRADASAATAILGTPPLFAGSQQVIALSVPSGNLVTPIGLDTEAYDNLGGHLTTTNVQNYYGMMPGWYLCQFTGAIAYTGGAGSTGAGIGVSVAGGAVTGFYGGRLANSGTASQETQVTGAKLVRMVNTGTQGGASNDYVCGTLQQDTGATQTAMVGASRWPQLSVAWVAAPSGTVSLPVPANPAWPVPPAYVTSAFLNANVRDTINYLLYPPIAEYSYQSGVLSLASQATMPSTGNNCPMDTATVDNYGAGLVTGINDVLTWTAPKNGVYWLYNAAAITTAAGSLAMAAGLTITSSLYNGGTTFTQWGTEAVTQASATQCAIVRRRLRLAAGDTVSPAAWQHDSAAAAATFAGGNCVNRFIALWRSA